MLLFYFDHIYILYNVVSSKEDKEDSDSDEDDDAPSVSSTALLVQVDGVEGLLT